MVLDLPGVQLVLGMDNLLKAPASAVAIKHLFARSFVAAIIRREDDTAWASALYATP